MITEKMVEALNRQLNAELYSAYLYLSMSACLENIKLRGFSNWMKMQAQEEVSHAMKFYDYVIAQRKRVRFFAIEKPPSEWESPLSIFENVLEHERHVTELIKNLVDMAIREKDESTHNMLQWFVKEQVEEEESANTILQSLKIAGEDEEALQVLNKKLEKRKPKSED